MSAPARTGCPVHEGFDPLGPPFLAGPLPVFFDPETSSRLWVQTG